MLTVILIWERLQNYYCKHIYIYLYASIVQQVNFVGTLEEV